MKTDPHGLPLHLSGVNGRGILILHGFSGYTGQLRGAAEAFHAAGYTVSLPRLPGHGTSGADFLSATPRDWLRRSLDSYQDLAGECAWRAVLGLSMGGLLAVRLAARVSPDALVLAAPALQARNPLLPLTPLLSPFLPRIKRKMPAKEPPTPELAPLYSEYVDWHWIRPGYRLLRVMIQARRDLKRITVPTMVTASRDDRTVPFEVMEYVRGKVKKTDVTTVPLDGCGHVIFESEQCGQIAAVILSWLETIGNR